MSNRIPTDRFGRALFPKSTPVVSSRARVNYDELFINADGDKMKGMLDMSKNKLTNIPTPTNQFDCANKVYVDKRLTEVTNSVKKDLTNRYAQPESFKGRFKNKKSVPVFIVNLGKDFSLTKNVLIYQFLIETEKGAWCDLQSFSDLKTLILYEKVGPNNQNCLYLTSTKALPKTWVNNYILVLKVVTDGFFNKPNNQKLSIKK